MIVTYSSRRLGSGLRRGSGLNGGNLDGLGLLDGDDGGSDGVRHYEDLGVRELEDGKGGWSDDAT